MVIKSWCRYFTGKFIRAWPAITLHAPDMNEKLWDKKRKLEDAYAVLFFYCHEGRMELLVPGREPVRLDGGQGLLLRGLPSGSRIAYEMGPGTRAVKAEIHEKWENHKN